MPKILVSLIYLVIFSLATVACTQTAPPATLDIPATVEAQVAERMAAIPTATVAQSPTATIPPASVAESRIYRDFYWGSYSIRLPQGWIVGSEIEPGYTGVSLTQLISPNADRGFFITVEDLERTAPGVSITLGELAHEWSNLRGKNGYTSEGVQLVDENTAYEDWLGGASVAPGCLLKGRTYYHLYSRWLISPEGSVCQSAPAEDFRELTDLMETIQIHPPAR